MSRLKLTLESAKTGQKRIEKTLGNYYLTLINNTYNIRIEEDDMSKAALKKEKWTLSFDPKLKKAVIREAENKGIYPVNYLEELVREKINPYGHTDVKDSVRYVRELRKKSKDATDNKFLEEILKWKK